MATTRKKHVYTLDELDDLIWRLRHEPTPPEELARRREHAAKSDCFLREMDPIPVPIEDLIAQAREEIAS
jgi:hypothetical protein